MPDTATLHAQELLQKFRDKKVDFAAHTQTEDGNAVFFNLIGAALHSCHRCSLRSIVSETAAADKPQVHGSTSSSVHPRPETNKERAVLCRVTSRPPRARLCAGNLAFPLLLVGGLFLLSRRSQGGPGGPGGQNAMNLGKSQAKFQMEPNTGITFDDVAGVEEAKQDFQEVRHGLGCTDAGARPHVACARQLSLVPA